MRIMRLQPRPMLPDPRSAVCRSTPVRVADNGPPDALRRHRIPRQYTLGYYATRPATDGTYRRVEVTMRDPQLTIRARRGYRAPRR